MESYGQNVNSKSHKRRNESEQRARTRAHTLASLISHEFYFYFSSVCVAAGRFHYRIDKFHSDISYDRVVSVCAQQCDIA